MKNLLIDIGLMALGWAGGFLITKFLVARDKKRREKSKAAQKKGG